MTAACAALAVLVPVLLTGLYAFAPPMSSLMLARLVSRQPVSRLYVEIGDMSPALIRSAIAAEDSKFCHHHGVDWDAILRQANILLEGGRPAGASTITMQLARNLFLWPQRSYIRKVIEIPLALMMDAVLTKRRTVELYLNIVELGPGIFGVESAAKAYFSRSAARLAPGLAALLMTALPNPHTRNPAAPSSWHRRRAAHIRNYAMQAELDVGCLGPLT